MVEMLRVGYQNPRRRFRTAPHNPVSRGFTRLSCRRDGHGISRFGESGNDLNAPETGYLPQGFALFERMSLSSERFANCASLV
jgi:hypothetical protein